MLKSREDVSETFPKTKTRRQKIKLFTLGHSNRSLEEFISLLESHHTEIIVDVRAFPVSTRYLHFHKKNLEASLNEKNIAYLWWGKELGGFRKDADGLGKDSPNQGWEKGGFRNYADYMLSEAFKIAAAKLTELAAAKIVACMCAEKFYWRCHRRLISDYLVSQGHEVLHILDKNKVIPHKLTSFAKIEDGKLTYPLR